MSISRLLFNADGRIGPRTFWRGVILLVAAQVVIAIVGQLVGALPLIAGFAFELALLYAYVCVYAKRFHDSGRGAGWFFLAFIGYFIVMMIVGGIIISLFAPEVVTAYSDVMEATNEPARNDAIEIFNNQLRANARILVIANMIGTFVANGLVGWFVARLKTEPRENRFGPPE